MHAKPMDESEGTFDGWKISERRHNSPDGCQGIVKFRCWESSCGGYEDYNYQCEECKKNWWVEGADA